MKIKRFNEQEKVNENMKEFLDKTKNDSVTSFEKYEDEQEVDDIYKPETYEQVYKNELSGEYDSYSSFKFVLKNVLSRLMYYSEQYNTTFTEDEIRNIIDSLSEKMLNKHYDLMDDYAQYGLEYIDSDEFLKNIK